MLPWAQFPLTMTLAQPHALYSLACLCKPWRGPMHVLSDRAVGCVVYIGLHYMCTPPQLIFSNEWPLIHWSLSARCPRVPFPGAPLCETRLGQMTTHDTTSLQTEAEGLFHMVAIPIPLFSPALGSCWKHLLDFSLVGGRSSTREGGFEGWKQPKAIQSQEW